MNELKIYEYRFEGGRNPVIISESRAEADKIYEFHFITRFSIFNDKDKWSRITVREHDIKSSVIISPDELYLDIEKHP